MNETPTIDLATQRQTFQALYLECLTECVRTMPDQYAYPVSQVPMVADRMLVAISKGTFNHDSHAFKMLAKRLKIKPTRQAILAAWEGRT